MNFSVLSIDVLTIHCKITFVDFILYELLDQHYMFEAPLIDENPNLKVNKKIWMTKSSSL